MYIFYSMLCMRHVFTNTGILEYMLQHTHILWWRCMAKPMLFYNIFIMFLLNNKKSNNILPFSFQLKKIIVTVVGVTIHLTPLWPLWNWNN